MKIKYAFKSIGLTKRIACRKRELSIRENL